MRLTRILLVLLLWLNAGAALALDIVLTNDDGFESANLRALYYRLKAAGNDVIVSAPVQNQSGVGGKLEYQRAMEPLARPSRYGSVPAGAPGVGVDPYEKDIHYVDGTPVMSLLYGLDVVAAQRWGHPPDLVISGPNEGGNLGPPIMSSGTVAAALYAINRGVPAIAVSDAPWDKVPWTQMRPDSRAWAVAAVVVRLVNTLQAQRRPGQPLLPRGTGLNVNLPALPADRLATAKFVATRIGDSSDYVPMFFAHLDDSPLAKRLGRTSALPGLSSALPGEKLPPGVVIPTDDDHSDEVYAVGAGEIAVSVMQGVPEADASQRKAVDRQLAPLWHQEGVGTRP